MGKEFRHTIVGQQQRVVCHYKAEIELGLHCLKAADFPQMSVTYHKKGVKAASNPGNIKNAQ